MLRGFVLFILLFDFLPLPVVLDFFVLFDFFPLFLGLELEDFFPLFEGSPHHSFFTAFTSFTRPRHHKTLLAPRPKQE